MKIYNWLPAEDTVSDYLRYKGVKYIPLPKETIPIKGNKNYGVKFLDYLTYHTNTEAQKISLEEQLDNLSHFKSFDKKTDIRIQEVEKKLNEIKECKKMIWLICPYHLDFIIDEVLRSKSTSILNNDYWIVDNSTPAEDLYMAWGGYWDKFIEDKWSNIKERFEKFGQLLGDKKINCFYNGIIGNKIQSRLPFIKFHTLTTNCEPIHTQSTFELLSDKKHIKEGRKSFFCIGTETPERPHRKLFNDAISKNNLDSYCTNLIHKKPTHYYSDVSLTETGKVKGIFQDLLTEYTDEWLGLGREAWLLSIPNIKLYNTHDFEVILETKGSLDGDIFHFTEKTVKAISMEHPFLVLSSQYFLTNLKGLGFETFGDYCDESYDLEEDHVKRCEMLVASVKDVCERGSEKFYEDTREICQHNRRILMEMSADEKTFIWRNLNETLGNEITKIPK